MSRLASLLLALAIAPAGLAAQDFPIDPPGGGEEPLFKG